MKLLAVGDSFTYGEELEDRNLAWPYLLGKKLNYDVTNLGKPSGGNTQIIRNVVENVYGYDLIIIAWSHFARIEFADELGVHDVWPGSQSYLYYDAKLKFRKDAIEYISRHHDDEYLFQQFLINVILLQDFLLSKKKKFVMLNAFGNNQFELISKNKKLANQIIPRQFLGWPKMTMINWTYGHPQGPRGHFLEDGHQRMTDVIHEHIRNLGWLS